MLNQANWYNHDKSSSEGNRVDTITKQYGQHQVIKKSTHILDNSYICVDLIFTSQPNLIMDSGVHPSLHTDCHHQIAYAKSILQIHFPPPYSRLFQRRRAIARTLAKAFRSVINRTRKSHF